MTTLVGWKKRVVEGAAMSEHFPAPDFDGALPHCDERCPFHDGKRCELTGFRPGTLCEPVVLQMATALAEKDTVAKDADSKLRALLVRVHKGHYRDPDTDALEWCHGCGVNGYSEHKPGCLVKDIASALAEGDGR